MDATLIVFRIIHVLSGIFWVGAMFFLSGFLVPALADVGPDGGKVMAALTRRGFMNVVPIVATLGILSGLWLYWKASSGFSPEYMRSGPGKAYGIGALCALIAFTLGMTVTRPAMLKAVRMGQAMANAEPADREKMMATMVAMRNRGATFGRIIGFLLLITATAMAVGRYV